MKRPRLAPDDRTILVLAVPALGALIAEPLFLLADAAIVGRLGTTELAGLGAAAAILATAVNVFVFLAYGTTAMVARRTGAGDARGALALGVDALWLATGLGAVVAVAGWALAGILVEALGMDGDVAVQAATYLRWSMPGVPGMLVVLAGSGVLRGRQDTRTPLLVSGIGAVVNALLNLLLVHGLSFGIAGSGAGTSLTQLGMAVAMIAVVFRGARRAGAPVRPTLAGVRTTWRAGLPLLVRTIAMRAVLLLTTSAAASLGVVSLAAHQVALTVWTLLALALDALAIAGQALTGHGLGAGDTAAARTATGRMVRWGVWGGVFLGVLMLAVGRLLGPIFSADERVQHALTAALIVAAVTQPLAGYVFVLDGVLIGAGDGRFLATAAVAQVVAYAPFALLIAHRGPGGTAGLVLLWVSFAGGWMAVRAVLLGRRVRGDAWLVTGAER